MNEPKTLLLRETGIARLADGKEAVNVGPIVSALGFLTEGRGEDRGVDEHGTPLPDLLSLAFDVVQSIILGGPQAEYFRRVKQDLDAQPALRGGGSLALAKKAVAVRLRTPASALEKAAKELRNQLGKLDQLSLAEEQAAELRQAIEEFRAFGTDRWVAATSHLLLALKGLTQATRRKRPKRAAKRKSPKRVPAPSRKSPERAAKPRKSKPKRKTKPKHG